jgi:hypothetical protein
MVSVIPIIAFLMVGCENEKTQSDPSEFLSKNSVIVPNLFGEWSWISTINSGWGSSSITPETEGYTKSIIFTSKQNYIEITNNHVSLETYFRIDSTDQNTNGKRIYTVTYFNSKMIPQSLIIDQVQDTICIYLSDNSSCFDCTKTSIYRKY